MSERRSLSFQSLDDVLLEVDRLLSGHAVVGQWTLGQILDHLVTALTLTTQGRPGAQAPPPRSEVFKKKFFGTRRFPEGVEVPHPKLLPAAIAEERERAAALRQAIQRWLAASGPFPPHPLLGPLSKEEWTEFHIIHCAHHLGFVIPREA